MLYHKENYNMIYVYKSIHHKRNVGYPLGIRVSLEQIPKQEENTAHDKDFDYPCKVILKEPPAERVSLYGYAIEVYPMVSE